MAALESHSLPRPLICPSANQLPGRPSSGPTQLTDPNRTDPTPTDSTEPAEHFSFTVTRASSHLFNLSCRAGPTFPRPSLALFRYRAGPLEPAEEAQRHSQRPRLAATVLRQEPLVGTQTQLTVSARRGQAEPSRQVGDSNEISTSEPAVVELEPAERKADEPVALSSPAYQIAAWALVEESSLNGNVATQFECLLSLEGAHYEQRQSLALQKGELFAPKGST